MKLRSGIELVYVFRLWTFDIWKCLKAGVSCPEVLIDKRFMWQAKE